MSTTEIVGWAATATFVVSYLFKNPMTLRWVQAGAALIWMTYGILLEAAPIIVANVLVAAMSIGSIIMGRRKGAKGEAPAERAA